MALVAAAVCPHPPLLVPSVAAGAAPELDQVRAACVAAVSSLAAAGADVLFVVGDAPERLAYSAADWGDLAPYGVRHPVRLGPGACAGQPILPLSLTLGAWLLHEADYRGDRQGYGVPSSVPPPEAAAIGAEIADVDDRVALLVMADGSARRSLLAPGYLDPAAAPFDAAVARALATADCGALLAVDPARADALLAAGRASWQVLAGAAAGAEWHASLDADVAPYGVGYFVATWRRAG